MKWSARLGRFAGIDVFRALRRFPLLLGWIGYALLAAQPDARSASPGLALVIAALPCVLLHEYGHALTARRFGIGTRYITLLPIGGVALLERMPRRSSAWRSLIALAGPTVNLVIAASSMPPCPGSAISARRVARARPGGMLASLIAANWCSPPST